MLAYAANRPLAGSRRPSPNALLLIIAAHVALVAAVMSAKMDLPRRISPGPILIPIRPDPPPPPPHAFNQGKTPKTVPTVISVDRPTSVDQVLRPISPPDTGVSVDPGGLIGATVAVTPVIPPTTTSPIHQGPRLLTRPDELKPPYPPSKLLTEEEGLLTLRLSIDDQGRVVAVEPIGRADRAFLEAARRHLLAHWRYQPAMDDGRAVASSMVITLRFQLNG